MVLADVGLLHLRRQVRADGDFVIARADAVGVGVGLALLACGGHLDFIGEHRLFLRRDGLGRLQVESDGELAVLVGTSFAVSDLLVLYGWVPPPPATPGEGGLADDAVAVFHIVQAEASVCLHIAMNRNFLVQFILLFRTFESNLKGRAFVFFHTDRTRAMASNEMEHAI